VPSAVTSFELDAAGALKGLVKLEFSAMDAWFEEDEEIFVHPKDPYKVLASAPQSVKSLQH
jgi:hypothetical protein